MKFTRLQLLEMLAERHAENRERIKCYIARRNVDGTAISSGHASTALSLTRKEQRVIELLTELVNQGRDTYDLSERAHEGLMRLVEPIRRHYDL